MFGSLARKENVADVETEELDGYNQPAVMNCSIKLSPVIMVYLGNPRHKTPGQIVLKRQYKLCFLL